MPKMRVKQGYKREDGVFYVEGDVADLELGGRGAPDQVGSCGTPSRGRCPPAGR